MDFRFVAPDLARLDETPAELLVAGVWEDVRPLPALAGLLDWRLTGRLSGLARESFLVGKLGEVLVVPGRPRLPYDKVMLLGLGPRAAFGDDAFRVCIERLLHTLEGLSIRRAVVELPGRGDDAVSPSRAAELLLSLVASGQRTSAHDAWVLVEPAEAQKQIAQRAQDERRRAMR